MLLTHANPAAPLSDFLPSNVTIHWGDGSTSAATAITQPGGTGTAFEVFGQHPYAEDGPTANPLQVTITDIGGAILSNTTSYTPAVADVSLTATSDFTVNAVEGVLGPADGGDLHRCQPRRSQRRHDRHH